VNEVNLTNASLDEAVQALKGAPRGIVRIGVSKPLPVPDSSAEDEDAAPPSTPPTSRTATSAASTAGDEDNTQPSLPDLPPDDAVPPPLPTSPPPADDELDVARRTSVELVSAAERLLGSAARLEERPAPLEDELIPPLPVELERHIRIVKDSDSLGVQVSRPH
jgi:hypothetical protein